MQIHEITHHPVNEVLGTMAAGVGKALANKFVSSQLPGVSLYGDDDDNSVKQRLPPVPPYTPPYKPPAPNFGQQQSGYASVNTNAPTGAALPATQVQPSTNTNIPAVQRKQTTAGTAPAAPTWQGTNINVPAVQRKQAAQAAAAPNIPAAIPAAAPKTPAVAAPAPSVAPRPGYRIMVQVPAGGKYYKTDKGWTNEVGQAITKPASVAALEKRADSAGREERITKPQPPRLSGKPVRTRRTR
jgi:hypothetical protein